MNRYEHSLAILSEMADRALMASEDSPRDLFKAGYAEGLRAGFEAVAALRESVSDPGARLVASFAEALQRDHDRHAAPPCAHTMPGFRCYVCQPD